MKAHDGGARYKFLINNGERAYNLGVFLRSVISNALQPNNFSLTT